MCENCEQDSQLGSALWNMCVAAVVETSPYLVGLRAVAPPEVFVSKVAKACRWVGRRQWSHPTAIALLIGMSGEQPDFLEAQLHE